MLIHVCNRGVGDTPSPLPSALTMISVEEGYQSTSYTHVTVREARSAFPSQRHPFLFFLSTDLGREVPLAGDLSFSPSLARFL